MSSQVMPLAFLAARIASFIALFSMDYLFGRWLRDVYPPIGVARAVPKAGDARETEAAPPAIS
jgi:hypothetical protein